MSAGRMVEKGETPREAALRELKEELLLKEDQISYLGDMDKLYSGGSLVMHSFATEVKGYQNTFNPAEVAEVFTGFRWNFFYIRIRNVM